MSLVPLWGILQSTILVEQLQSMAQEATSCSCAAPLSELSLPDRCLRLAKVIMACDQGASEHPTVSGTCAGADPRQPAKAAQDILSALDLLPFRGPEQLHLHRESSHFIPSAACSRKRPHCIAPQCDVIPCLFTFWSTPPPHSCNPLPSSLNCPEPAKKTEAS